MILENKFSLKKILTIFLVFENFILTTQQETCMLPDRRHQSMCIRLHNCDSLMYIVRKYYGRPPEDLIKFILSHKCGNKRICCPDNAISTTPSPTTTSTVPPQIDQRLADSAVDLDKIRSHKNFELINEKTCGHSTSFRLNDGENADLKEFPWAVLLGYQLLDSFDWLCGGSLISKRFVLTAAHCVTRELTTVRLGEHTISTPEDCDESNGCADPVQDIKIERKIIHPLYKRFEGHTNDIGLLKLELSADFTKNNVQTICLPTYENSDIEKIKSIRPLYVAGWSKNGAVESSDILQKSFASYVENDECAKIFAEYPEIKIDRTSLCAGKNAQFNNATICYGDSGSGISTFAPINKRQKMTLYGVSSTGIKCEHAEHKYPVVYTNIKYYLQWILDNMSQ